MLNTKEEAYALLESLGAPKHLVVHVQWVGEAAEELLLEMRLLDLEIRGDIVRLGAAIHDAGKIIHPNVLRGEGNEHEPSGETLLLEAGVQPEIARCCISHARYESMDVSFEELLVALSDKLWKGKGVESLELRVIDRAAELLGEEQWDVFGELDECFEKIASKGDQRLARSIGS